jgi:hypothetical protein
MFGRLAEIIPAYEEYVAKLKVRYENGVNARHPPSSYALKPAGYYV